MYYLRLIIITLKIKKFIITKCLLNCLSRMLVSNGNHNYLTQSVRERSIVTVQGNLYSMVDYYIFYTLMISRDRNVTNWERKHENTKSVFIIL